MAEMEPGLDTVSSELSVPGDPVLVELRYINARLTENLQVLAAGINLLSDRITALDSRLQSQEGTVTDHNAELIGKALRVLANG